MLIMAWIVAEQLKSGRSFCDVGFRPSAPGVDTGNVINRNEPVLYRLAIFRRHECHVARPSCGNDRDAMRHRFQYRQAKALGSV
jgi:hypothetical protein